MVAEALPSSLGNLRRYYLLARLSAQRIGRSAEASVWQAKQQAEDGTALPAGFPFRAELALAGYTTDADLEFANESELADYAGLSQTAASKVFAALAAL